MRVIVTRPSAQADAWVEALRQRGVHAQALPLIGIAPPLDVEPVHAAWRSLPQRALVMFVSANAVEHFFAARPAGALWPASLAAGSTGPGTSAALRAAGVSRIEEPAADAAQFDSEALWQRLAGQAWQGRQVLIVRGEGGRDWLAGTLAGQGAQVDFVAAYRRLAPRLDAAGQALLRAALAAPAEHLWVFSSSEAVGRLAPLAPQADWSASQAVASHPRIAQAAREAGFGRVDPVPPDVEALVRWLAHRAG